MSVKPPRSGQHGCACAPPVRPAGRRWETAVSRRMLEFRKVISCFWVVKELKLSCHNHSETIFFTMYPAFGTFNQVPQQQASILKGSKCTYDICFGLQSPIVWSIWSPQDMLAVIGHSVRVCGGTRMLALISDTSATGNAISGRNAKVAALPGTGPTRQLEHTVEASTTANVMLPDS